MNSQTIKLELINWLTKLKDKKILGALSLIMDSEESGDWYDSVTATQKKSLDKGIKDHQKGSTISSKQFWERNGKQA